MFSALFQVVCDLAYAGENATALGGLTRLDPEVEDLLDLELIRRLERLRDRLVQVLLTDELVAATQNVRDRQTGRVSDRR